MQTSVPISLLDRLNAQTIEHPSIVKSTFHAFKQSLAKDIEILLNTKFNQLYDTLPDFKMASKTFLTYGIPDIYTLNILDTDSRFKLEMMLYQALINHENRLQNIKVSMLGIDDQHRRVNFRIDASVCINEEIHHLFFLTQINHKRFSVKEG